MFDCIIVGGGISGLQAAIQLGRYHRSVVVLDANRGRSTICRSYQNLLGWPMGVSGLQLRRLGREQALKHGVVFENTEVIRVDPGSNGFVVRTEDGCQYEGHTLLLATGIVDHVPPIPGLLPILGIRLFVCPDCDGYECTGKETVILGAGNAGANMALTLLHWTSHITYVNHFGTAVSDSLWRRMEECGIRYVDGEIEHVESTSDAELGAVVLVDGRIIRADCGFLAFGGNKVESSLAKQLGVKCNRNHHIAVHPRTKMTSVHHVWAAGDVVAHSEQVSIAMGDGAQAAIFIHKALLGELVEGHDETTE